MIKTFAKKLDYEIPEILKPFVVAIILGETKAPIKTSVPMYATGFPLIIHVFGDRPTFTINGRKYKTESDLVIAGQIFNAKIEAGLNGKFGQLGIIIQPTALYYLFHKPGARFNNKWTSLEESSPLKSSYLNETLFQIKSNHHRIEAILNFLSQLAKERLAPIDWLDNSLKRIFENNGKIEQEELVQNLGISSRHFRRTFTEVIGVPPKYFCKVIQLNTVFELLKNSAEEKIHHLALDCGYYDQSHFIHDFHSMIGESPYHFLNSSHSFIKDYMGRRGF